MHISLLFLLFFIFFGDSYGETLSPDCDLQGSTEFSCQNIGNMIIGPKGLKRIFDETVNNPKFKKQIKEKIAESFKKMPKQVWYKTPKKCQTVMARDFAKSFVLKKSLPVSEGCILAPHFDSNGRIMADTKAVPIELATENIYLDENNFEFEMADPVCEMGQCRSQIRLKKIALISNFTIRTADGKLLSGPSYRIKMDSEKNIPASLDAVLIVEDGGKLNSISSGFKRLKVNPETFNLEQVIRQNNKVYEMSDLIYPESQRDTKSDRARKRELTNLKSKYLFPLQCDAVKALLENKDPEEEYTNQFLEYKRKNQRASVLSASDQQDLNRGLEYVRKNKSRKSNLNCKDIPADIFASTKDFDEAYDIAEAKVAGFRDLQTQWLFDGVVSNVMAQETIKDEEFVNAVIVPEIQKQALNEAQKYMQKAIADLSQTVNPLLEQEFQLPLINMDLQTRISNADSTLDKLKKQLSYLENEHPIDYESQKAVEQQKLEALAKTRKILEVKEKLESEANKQESLQLNTNYLLDSIDNMNRIRIVNRKDLCKSGVSIPGLVDGITQQKELGNNEFAFEFPISTLQKYIDEMYKKFPYLCSEGTQKDCSDGTKVKLPNAPKLKCDGEKACLLDFGMVIAQAMGGKHNFNFTLNAKVEKCKEGNRDSVCLSFDKPEVKNRDALIWLYDVLPGPSIQGKVKKAMKTLGEIDIGSLLPQEIHESFAYGKPIV
ncbi:MAG: hypothetical protein H6625_07675 [Bdellovibrionaceae bacterium]|nr:hypothetical protein [Pseudobdellovibrionaceae bacterium]